jgi:hypothetical protein
MRILLISMYCRDTRAARGRGTGSRGQIATTPRARRNPRAQEPTLAILRDDARRQDHHGAGVAPATGLGACGRSPGGFRGEIDGGDGVVWITGTAGPVRRCGASRRRGHPGTRRSTDRRRRSGQVAGGHAASRESERSLRVMPHCVLPPPQAGPRLTSLDDQPPSAALGGRSSRTPGPRRSFETPWCPPLRALLREASNPGCSCGSRLTGRPCSRRAAAGRSPRPQPACFASITLHPLVRDESSKGGSGSPIDGAWGRQVAGFGR